MFFLTQPLVWRFRFVDWWTVLFVLLCGTALAMLIWSKRAEKEQKKDVVYVEAGEVLETVAQDIDED